MQGVAWVRFRRRIPPEPVNDLLRPVRPCPEVEPTRGSGEERTLRDKAIIMLHQAQAAHVAAAACKA